MQVKPRAEYEKGASWNFPKAFAETTAGVDVEHDKCDNTVDMPTRNQIAYSPYFGMFPWRGTG